MPATFEYTGNGNVPSNGNLEERVNYSYNESSAIHIDELDYGSISSSIDDEEDYGSISNTDVIVGWNYYDYGSITINQTIVPFGSIFTHSLGDISLVKINVGSVQFTVLGEAYIFTTPIEFGSGFVGITGSVSDVKINLSYFGSGTLSGITGAAEALVINPVEETLLFRVGGESTESISPAPHVGSGSLFSFVSSEETLAFAHSSDGPLFKVVGEVLPVITVNYIGSGTLSAITGAAEALGVNPPEETPTITIRGEADEQFIKNNEQSTLGSLFVRGEATRVVLSRGYDVSGIIEIESAATESTSPAPHVGSGSLFTFIGTEQARSVNPETETALFKINGIVEESATSIYSAEGTFRFGSDAATTLFNIGNVGSGKLDIAGNLAESISPAPHVGKGSLFTFVSTTEASTVDLPESTVLIKVSGSAQTPRIRSHVSEGTFKFGSDEALILFTLGHIGSGTADVNGNVGESITPAPHVGEGSLFAFVGTTDSVTVNPPDRSVLHRFAGSAVERSTDYQLGSGNALLTGTAEPVLRARAFAGSGNLFAIVGSTYSISVKYEAQVLFEFSGNSSNSQTNVETGTGSLFTFVSATESTLVSPTEEPVLLKFSGSSVNRFVRNEIGSGTLSAITGAAESITVSPDDTKVLFAFEGSSPDSVSRPHIGSGSLFSFVGSAESVTFNPPDQTLLFTFNGSATESVTPAPHVGSGTLFAFTGATESILVSPKSTKDNTFRFVGNAKETTTNAYGGKGSLFGIVGSQDAVAINYALTVGLFAFSGRGFESFSNTNYDGYASTRIIGQSTDRRIEFKKGQAPRIILI